MNNTNVRSIKLLWRLSALTIPGYTEQAALRRIMTPTRQERSGVPQPSGLLTVHRTMDTGRHRLAAWEWGPGPVAGWSKAPAVLLLHGWDGEARDLQPFIVPLVQAGFRVLAADLPAHGRSSGAQAGVADWQRAVIALARQAGAVQGVVAAGLGATVALRAALDGTELGRLVLLAPTASPAASLRQRALALGYPSDQVPALLEEYETAQHVRLEAWDLRSLAHRVRQPLLILEETANAEAVLSQVLPFLRHGTLPGHGAIASMEYKVAV